MDILDLHTLSDQLPKRGVARKGRRHEKLPILICVAVGCACACAAALAACLGRIEHAASSACVTPAASDSGLSSTSTPPESSEDALPARLKPSDLILAYARWLRVYAKQAGITYNTKFPLCARTQLVTICRLIGLLWAFYLAYEGHVSVSSFAAFSTAYGMAMGCLDAAAIRFPWIAQLGPRLKRGEPILQAVPEYGTGTTMVTELSGAIELSHVTFRYDEGGPAVVDDLSLSIQPGEYVGIVGRSGCGKSTLVKLLLGFETPQEGTISYDEYDLSTTNLKSLRRHIGTVLQDGKLFAGDIYSNIAITAPHLSEEEAWDAAEKVGMAEDLRRMPMGMRTLVSEGSGGISGGQRQRLMIARAIVGRPRILIMDEATSALDNLTQRTVTESLDALDCTRIVIAHRLSTIRSCDRIVALDRGRIVESGSYDELIERGGFFADLVKRQQIDEG